MSDPVLLVENDAGVATVTLNRPHAMNALSRELRDATTRAFRELDADPETRVVILTGSGRAFCAGLDLKELGGESRAKPGEFSDADMISAVRDFQGPVIAAVNGFAITGGFELALACDLIIAGSEARFADTHARVGILPGWGLSQRLPRLIGVGRAKELAFTGNYLSAEQACAWGLANRVVPAGELLAVCRALASDMLSCDPASLCGYKQLIDTGYGTSLDEGLAFETRASRDHMKGVTRETIAGRRRSIQDRGRSQSR